MSMMDLRKSKKGKRGSGAEDDEDVQNEIESNSNHFLADAASGEDDEKCGLGAKKSRLSDRTTVEISVSFGGRSIVDPASGNKSLYESVSTGALSDTYHAKKFKLTIEKEFDQVTFDEDIMPHIKSILAGMPVAVEFDKVFCLFGS